MKGLITESHHHNLGLKEKRVMEFKEETELINISKMIPFGARNYVSCEFLFAYGLSLLY